MVLSDLSSGAQDTIVPEDSIAIATTTIINDTATAAAIVSKDICLPANHCHILAIYELSTRIAAGACCGYHDDEGWYYKVTFDGITINEGNKFQSSDYYLQFGGGCQMPSKDKSANDRRFLLTAGDASVEYNYVQLDEEGRRYFPRLPDISELGQSVSPLPDCSATEQQGRTGCIVNPSSSRGASVPLPSISHKQNPACDNDICTLGIPMSKQHVDFAAEQLLLNDQHIGFTEAKTKSLPDSYYRSYGIAAGDLDGDGLVDLIVATGLHNGIACNNKIYLNSGNKANPFTKIAIDLPDSNGDSSVVKLADIDNDSLLDILLISDGKAFVFFNSITDPLNFSRWVELDIGDLEDAYDLSVGDANNDGWLDIIVGTDSGIVLFLNMHQNDAFDTIELPQYGRANQVEFVDIDNDGRIDIISLSKRHVRVFMNKYGNGTFLKEDLRIVLQGEYQRFCVSDINGDEFPDLILAKWSKNNIGSVYSVELLVNNGGTGFHDSKTLIPPQANLNIRSIEAGDLNGDGMIDLVIGGTGGGISSNFMILNEGGGEFAEAIDLPGTSSWTRGIVIADVNNDSALDIVVFANRYGEVDKVLLNLLPIDSSESFGAALSLPGGARDTYSMAVANFNEDGFIDIVVGNFNGANQILLNNGDGSFLEEGVIYLPTSLSSSSTYAVAVGEIIGDDNLPDIVVCGNDGCEILRNNGDLTFDPISISGWASYAIGIGDVNNDTFMDVIIGGYRGDGDTLFINNNGIFSTDNTIKLPGFDATNDWTRSSSITLADFNGDKW